MTDAQTLKQLDRAIRTMIACTGVFPTRAQIESFRDLVDRTQNRETCDVQPSVEVWESARDLCQKLEALDLVVRRGS
jgi:hypothetical protein